MPQFQPAHSVGRHHTDNHRRVARIIPAKLLHIIQRAGIEIVMIQRKLHDLIAVAAARPALLAYESADLSGNDLDLAIAFLIVPVVAARPLSRTPEQLVTIAALTGTASVAGGLTLSSSLDAPGGPAIVLCMAILAGLSLLLTARR